MQRIAMSFALSGALLAAVGTAPARAQAPPASEAETNTGQDPTRPLTRVDFRLKHREGPGDGGSQTFTLRADKPFALSGGWKLSTRVDLPFARNDVVSGDNPSGDWEVGASDLLVQALVITPPKGLWDFAFGGQVIAPTAAEDQFGGGQWQLAPTVAVVRQLPNLRPGSFAAALIKSQFNVSHKTGRKDVNDLVVEPIFNINLPDQWFVSFAPEARFDLENGGDMFLPFDVTLGRKIGKRLVASLQADVALIKDYPQYDWQVEARLGVFF